MIIPKELSPEAHQKIKKINRIYGAKKPFMKKARIYPSTFKRLVEVGNAWADIIDRVEAALAEEAPLKRVATAEIVQTMVCTGYGITPEALHAPGRQRVLVEAKQVACLLMLEEAHMSKAAIAKYFGYKHHTAVTWVINTIGGLMGVEIESELRERVERIRKNIQAAS